MGKASRVKGAAGEREVAAIFQAAGFDVNRVPNSGALRLKGDLYGEAMPIHVEVKRRKSWGLSRAWIVQAETEAPADKVPVIAFRADGEPWRVCLGLVEFLEILKGER